MLSKSIYNEALSAILCGDDQKAQECLRIYTQKKRLLPEQVSQLFRAARSRRKENGNFHPCLVMHAYWRVCTPDIQKATVYSFYWIVYDLIKDTLEGRIQTGSVEDYLETAVSCSSLLDTSNSYVVKWFQYLQQLVVGNALHELSPVLLKTFLNQFPLNQFPKDLRHTADGTEIPSEYECCAANMIKAYTYLQQYETAYQIVNEALKYAHSWRLYQQKGFLEYLLGKRGEALRSMFFALTSFHSDWKFSVRLLKESIQLMNEYHWPKAAQVGFSVYQTVCTAEGWTIDKTLCADTSTQDTLSSRDLPVSFRNYLISYRNLVATVFRRELSTGEILQYDALNKVGVLKDINTFKAYSFHQSQFLDDSYQKGDYVLFSHILGQTQSNDLQELDFIFWKSGSRKHIANHDSKAYAAEQPHQSLHKKIHAQCALCGADILVQPEILHTRGAQHILCRSCYASENLLKQRGDPYFGLQSILRSVRDEHTMFDVHA